LVLECVVNISEGRDAARIDRIAAVAGEHLLDVHTDPHHHRSVLTLVGEEATQAVAVATIAELDLREHVGAHPRLGVLDVVPFVALAGSRVDDAVAARDRFARWLGDVLLVPCFLYGTERTLPDVRRRAFTSLRPDTGPGEPHPTAGATAVGQRPPLVAYNVWAGGVDLATVRAVAARVRSPQVRALGLEVGDRLQVSMNLVDPFAVGPAPAFDAVAQLLEEAGGRAEGAELVGLLPDDVLRAVPTRRWVELDLAVDRTIEARLGR
jgi:glutamate formiminotransferase / 5-formyltetrahydrofolate cyclo-ligase